MDEKNTPPAGAQDAQTTKARLAIKRVYVKDVSFEVPAGAQAFARQWQPRVDQDLATKVNKLGDDQYEVVLAITVSVREEEQVLCVAEVEQAGIFMVAGVEGENLARTLNTQCPAILFPYARELIDSLVVRGTLPALMLPPVNFDALYQQILAEQQKTRDEQPKTLN